MKTRRGGIGTVRHGYELDPQHPGSGRASADRHLAARLLRSHRGPARRVGAEPVGDQRRPVHADQRPRRRHGGARQGGLRTRFDLGCARGGRAAARGPAADARPAGRARRGRGMGHRAARQRARRQARDPRRRVRRPHRRRADLSRGPRRRDHRDRVRTVAVRGAFAAPALRAARGARRVGDDVSRRRAAVRPARRCAARHDHRGRGARRVRLAGREADRRRGASGAHRPRVRRHRHPPGDGVDPPGHGDGRRARVRRALPRRRVRPRPARRPGRRPSGGTG